MARLTLMFALLLLSGCTIDAHVVITQPAATARPVVAPFVTSTPVPPVSPLAAPESPLMLTPDVRPYTDALPMPGTTSGTVGNTPGD